MMTASSSSSRRQSKLNILLIFSLLVYAVEGATVQYPVNSYQLVDETIEIPCQMNGFRDEQVLRYPTQLFSRDSLNAYSATVSFWMRISNPSYSSKPSLLFYLTNDITNDDITNVIVGFALDNQNKPMYFDISTQLFSSFPGISALSIGVWNYYALSASFDVYQYVTVNFYVYDTSFSAITSVSKIYSIITGTTFTDQAVFNDDFQASGGMFLGSSLTSLASLTNPACAQFRQVQIHMNSVIIDSTIIKMLMLSPARLEMYYTFDEADVFTSATYLRDKSPKENHVLLAGSVFASTPTPIGASSLKIWQFNIQSVLDLPGVAFREAISVVYWVYLQSATVEVATISIGAGATEAKLKIQHIYSSGSFSTSLNSVNKLSQIPFSDTGLRDNNWNFIKLTIFPSTNKANLNILIASSSNIGTLSTTFSTTGATFMDVSSSSTKNFARITLGSSLSSQLILRDFKVLTGSQFFTGTTETLGSDCLLSYGSSVRRCLICNLPHYLRDDGTCVLSCPTDVTLASVYSFTYRTDATSAKCLPCPAATGTYVQEKIFQNTRALSSNYYSTSYSSSPVTVAAPTITITSNNILVVADSNLSNSSKVTCTWQSATSVQFISIVSVSMTQHVFTSVPGMNSGFASILPSTPTLITFSTPYSITPKVVISILNIDLTSISQPTLVTKKVSTHGFIVNYSSLSNVVISWMAVPNYMEVFQTMVDGSSKIQTSQVPFADYYSSNVDSFFGIISVSSIFTNPISPLNMHAILNLYQTPSSTYYQTHQTAFTSPSVEFDILLLFVPENTMSICLPATTETALGDTKIGVIESFQIAQTPKPIHLRASSSNELPQVNTDVLFALKNFDTQYDWTISALSTKQLVSPREIAYSITSTGGGSSTPEYFYFASSSFPGKIVTKIYTIPSCNPNAQVTLDETLKSTDVIIKPSIVGFQSGLNGAISKVTADSVNTLTLTCNIAQLNDFFQVQFLILPPIPGMDYDIVNPTALPSQYDSEIIFGFQGISYSAPKLTLVKIASPTSPPTSTTPSFTLTLTTAVPSSVSPADIWVLKGIIPSTPVGSNPLPDNMCMIRRSADFRCNLCYNQLLYTRDTNFGATCECPLSFGYDSSTSTCTRCQFGCLSCFVDSNTQSGTLTCLKCDTTRNFQLQNGSCTCKVGYYGDKDSTTCILDISNRSSLPVKQYPLTVSTAATTVLNKSQQNDYGTSVKNNNFVKKGR